MKTAFDKAVDAIREKEFNFYGNGVSPEFIEAIKVAVDKYVIGIDELEASEDGSKQYQGAMSRNKLRRAQRKRL